MLAPVLLGAALRPAVGPRLQHTSGRRGGGCVTLTFSDQQPQIRQGAQQVEAASAGVMCFTCGAGAAGCCSCCCPGW